MKQRVSIREFIKDRDNLLATFDEDGEINYKLVEEYCKRHKVTPPESNKQLIEGLHQSRLSIDKLFGISNKEFLRLKRKSKEWLEKSKGEKDD